MCPELEDESEARVVVVWLAWTAVAWAVVSAAVSLAVGRAVHLAEEHRPR